MKIVPVCALKDNYVWMLHDGNDAIIVDPGDADPVIPVLLHQGLILREIWITHHHSDHLGGVPALVEAYPEVRVRASPPLRLPHVTHRHADNDTFTVFETVPVVIWAIPGHTADHIGFLLASPEGPHFFCGDTLFGAGCGRILGGTVDELFTSLCRINTLPPATQIYCAHEYTESNIRFALHVDPTNVALKERELKVRQSRQQGIPTVPLLLEEERLTNPFLRCETSEICTTVLKNNIKNVAYPNEIFGFLRKMKDAF